MKTSSYTESSALVSPCGTYRYYLTREWDRHRPCCMWVMLNPSTADARQDDPTIRRCVGFAQGWGYGSIVVCNLFAFRATDPRELANAADPVGPDNDACLQGQIAEASRVICGWGVLAKKWVPRADHVLGLIRAAGYMPYCVKRTRAGFPSHPLYLPQDLKSVAYRGIPQ
jgi:hypothetical protein